MNERRVCDGISQAWPALRGRTRGTHCGDVDVEQDEGAVVSEEAAPFVVELGNALRGAG